MGMRTTLILEVFRLGREGLEGTSSMITQPNFFRPPKSSISERTRSTTRLWLAGKEGNAQAESMGHDVYYGQK